MECKRQCSRCALISIGSLHRAMVPPWFPQQWSWGSPPWGAPWHPQTSGWDCYGARICLFAPLQSRQGLACLSSCSLGSSSLFVAGRNFQKIKKTNILEMGKWLEVQLFCVSVCLVFSHGSACPGTHGFEVWFAPPFIAAFNSISRCLHFIFAMPETSQ